MRSIILNWQKAIINVVLKCKCETKSYDICFDKLQSASTRKQTYLYDSISKWTRAAKRVEILLEKLPDLPLHAKILDAGTGDGMVGVLLKSFGFTPTLADEADWRDDRAKDIKFIASPLETIGEVCHEKFDLVCSYNTFEHLRDPAKAFFHLIDLLSPGGYLFLEFGPLYNGPWGYHLYNTIKVPYSQFLFSNELINEKIKELGVYDLGDWREAPQFLNKWSFGQFNELWYQNRSVDVIYLKRIQNLKFTKYILKYRKAFCGRNLNFNDLTTQGIQVIIRKTTLC